MLTMLQKRNQVTRVAKVICVQQVRRDLGSMAGCPCACRQALHGAGQRQRQEEKGPWASTSLLPRVLQLSGVGELTFKKIF